LPRCRLKGKTVTLPPLWGTGGVTSSEMKGIFQWIETRGSVQEAILVLHGTLLFASSGFGEYQMISGW